MSEFRRLRIQCDGDSWKNLSVTDAETGEYLRVVSVKFEADMRQAKQFIEVVVIGGAIDITGNATVLTVCPRCRQEMDTKSQLPESSLRVPMPPVKPPAPCDPSREDPSKTTSFGIA